MSDFVKHNQMICQFSSSKPWMVLSSIEQNIKHKMERCGTCLNKWEIEINYGIKTGCNDAFVIDTETREKILAQCETVHEREETAQLIRPILRGRDIKRYSYNWSDLWLIATFPSRNYNIEDYPSVKRFLLSFGIERLEQTGITHLIDGKKVKARKKTKNKWFEIQDSIAYWDLFFKPKICWKAVGRQLAFSIVEEGIYLTAPASFISAPSSDYYILAFLCSSVGKYFIYTNSDTTGAGDIMLNIQSLVKFPIPLPENDENERLKQMIYNKNDEEIDKFVFSKYNLTNEEIQFIKSHL